ncbi:MAG: ABC transporter ATP-binding protein [Erysipelotrichaceae bacterium]|nr:ABC transporter ATP-binding protein [Erysipelotrichaceae bacterium]
MDGIVKIFGKRAVLDQVRLHVKKGTVHAILGENGAGKSTLMNILYGLYQPDGGTIKINGTEIDMKNPSTAIAHGIGMVHQHFMLVDVFTVAENIILGQETVNGIFLDMKKARQDVLDLIEKYGLAVDPDAKIEDISVGMQQRVEILKALYRGADILILDEPTAVLTPQEIDELIEIINNLINDGKTVLIITHKLDEIKKSSDECTIIRRGKYIDTVKVADVSQSELADMMVGHQVNLKVDKTLMNPKHVILEVDNVHAKDVRGVEVLKGLSFKIRSGEIYGIAGIDGNGQKELLEAITNMIYIQDGKIKVNGKEIQNTTTWNTISSGVATIHEDREKRGLIPDFSVEDNFVLETFMNPPYSKNGRMQKEEIAKFAKKMIEDYDIRPAGCSRDLIRGLSGGNQQKVIIAREIANDPDLLIAMQPTRGLDVGAIENIHKMLLKQRDLGKAVLLISLELDEVMNVADTIGVIYDGRIVKEMPQSQATEREIGLLMAGGSKNE